MEKQSRVVLKNIKRSEFASQETHCYQASIYFDGKKLGLVGNDGHGGCDHEQADEGTSELWIEMGAYIKTLPRSPWGFAAPDGCSAEEKADHLLGMPESLESICGGLVNTWLVSADLKRALKSKVLYIKDGSVFEISWKGTRKIDQRHIDSVKKSHAGEKILNDMPFDEALELYAAA